KLLVEANKQCGVGIEDDRVRIIATLKFAHELGLGRMIEHGDFDANDLLRISEELRRLMPPPAPPKVEIGIVDTLIGICAKCGHEHAGYKPPEPETAGPRPAATSFNSNKPDQLARPADPAAKPIKRDPPKPDYAPYNEAFHGAGAPVKGSGS